MKKEMGILQEDLVIIRQTEKEDEATEITINCPDKTGLGCDLCRIILFFGLSIIKGDVSTDGKWCYLVFWVVGKSETRWSLLKRRLVEACPSCSSASDISFFRSKSCPVRPPDVFLLTFCCHDRRGLLHDVTQVLCELELTIKKLKVSTTPDGKVIDMFFVTDTRELLDTVERKDETYQRLKSVTGDAMISCKIEKVGLEITACSQELAFLPPAITEDSFVMEMPDDVPIGSLLTSSTVSIAFDNKLSPSHTLIQIVCHDHKGLLYDIMRTLKDYNIQISYGRFSIKKKRDCEIDMFIVQTDGKKVVDSNKQKSLASRLRLELLRPLRVAVVSRGPDTELLVTNPVELSGKGRPLVFYDITLSLKKLNTAVFLAEIRRHIIGGREWEVYRILLDEGDGMCVPRNMIEQGVWKMLMGWE